MHSKNPFQNKSLNLPNIKNMLAIVERKSKFILIRKLPKKQAELVAETTIDLFNP